MSEITTAAFLAKGTNGQFRYVLSLYDEALRLKAEAKSKKPQELIKLDQWYQKEFPKKIQSRGKDPHIIHDELVTIMKWKLARGKFRPRLKELVTMNSPRVVETESRKAFRALFKKDDLGASIQYLCNLKGIGPATASAIVTAAAPDRAAFMADECLAAVPEIEGIDYTLQEYLEMLKHIQQAVTRLGGPEEWNPHQIELALWTHHILLNYNPHLLQNMPDDTIPPQEDSLGSTVSSDSKEMFNQDSCGDSNGTSNADYTNYNMEQSSSFVTNDEDTLDNVVGLKCNNSMSPDAPTNGVTNLDKINGPNSDADSNPSVVSLRTAPTTSSSLPEQESVTSPNAIIITANNSAEEQHLEDPVPDEKKLNAAAAVAANDDSAAQKRHNNSSSTSDQQKLPEEHDQKEESQAGEDPQDDSPLTKKPKLSD